MDVATRHLGENARKIFIVELFDIITMQQKHIGEMCSMTILNKFNYQCEVTDYLENVRYDVLTSNIVESVNAMFNEAREFPIIALFNDISKRWSKKFHERRMAYAKLKTTFVPSAETKIMANKNLGNKLLVHQIDEDTFSVTADNGIAMVHLRNPIYPVPAEEFWNLPLEILESNTSTEKKTKPKEGKRKYLL
ncbi:hypothetical protein H5410_043898 [Solanum commersonii]|uniref:Uncharacterized protein n=1 Tax=Solanum commersonii TaxID=4109 RepID=A0A9J5Y1I3_SOLCO|nr:hypothetical protein H5410_043898 [Solanum commersonii]